MENQIKFSDYLKGFNEGYVVTQHLPDLAQSLATLASKSERLEGFRDGQKQFVLELAKDQRPRWLSPDRHCHSPPFKDKDRDLDKY